MDDLTNLTDLSDATLLDVLRTRYQRDQIYTCIGDIIVATNPYKTLPIYGQQIKQDYKDLKDRAERAPHIYMISDRTYQNLMWNGYNQCCVVCGESGAGKTESTKLLIEHIAFLCKHDDSKLNKKIVEVNPLLEAFGNAQTVINNNSSRFGKFIELIFDKSGQIEGAKISEYLLEKSRVVFHAPGEKNFHIFYYFFAGVEQEKQRSNRLQAPEKHRIMMNQDGRPIYTDDNQRKECEDAWSRICAVMERVGFRPEEINDVEGLLSVIVLISDITFVPHAETEGVSIKDDDAVMLCAELLGVNAEKLVDSMIIFKNKVGGEDMISLKNEMQANDGRDALAKALYGRLFIWIVSRINQLLAPKSSSRSDNNWIGILDIYGFENFQKNSFEQLCINIANEQLQLFFNQHIFQMELSEYEREGVPGNAIQFVNNKPLLELFFETNNPPGILAILDEESKFPQSSDQSFIDKLVKNFSANPSFQSTKGQSMIFTIKHFAGPVMYSVEGFLEKNRDTLSDNISECLGESECMLVYELFSPMSNIHMELESTGRKKRQRISVMINNFTSMRSQRVNSSNQMKRASVMMSSGKTSSVIQGGAVSVKRTAKTLAKHFAGSLQGLTEKMINAEPHFVRCIKPNAHKEPNNFFDEMVLDQLNYTGVLETVKIRKQGFPARLLFNEFIHRYGMIVGILQTDQNAGRAQTVSFADICSKILETSKLTGWQIGKTKVFLKHWHIDKLNLSLAKASETIVACQKYWRAVTARRKLASLKTKALEYKRALAELNATACEIGEKFVEFLGQSLEQDRKTVTKEEKEDTIAIPTMATVRFKKNNQPIRVDTAPQISSIWNPVAENSKMEPCFVFLKESIQKINVLPKEIWCKLYLMEKNAIIGKLYIRDVSVTLNDTEHTYTGKVIGINSKDFEHLSNPQCLNAIKQIGKGVLIQKDVDGNVFITRLSDVEVHVLGDEKMALSKMATKVFDIDNFKKKVALHLKSKEAQEGKIDVCLLARLSVFNFSIGRLTGREVDLPLWISIINIQALDLLGQEKVLQEFGYDGMSSEHMQKIKVT